MKRMRIIFPLMFLIALAGSAFTRQSHSAKKDFLVAYYQDPTDPFGSCQTTELSDDKCVTDEVGNVCKEYILGVGPVDMWQYNFGSYCLQVYYSYAP